MMAANFNLSRPPTRNGGHGRGPVPPQADLDRQQATGEAAYDAAVGRLNSLSIHFSNIRGLRSNFQSVEHHLAVSSPALLLLSETQLSSSALPDLYSVTNYNLFSRFRFKGGVCAYCNTSIPVARLMDLESSVFDAIWLKISLSTITIYLCFLYFSPNASNYEELFNYLTTCHESLLSSHPNAEIIYCGDFNTHHTEWLGSTRTDPRGIEAYSFSLLNDLEQIIKHPTRVPDRHDQSSNILDLFLTTNPSHYNYTISAPLGSSDHNLISVSSDWARPPPLPPSKRQLWHFERANWLHLRDFYSNFSWSDCFPCRDVSVCTELVTLIIMVGMRLFIPCSTKTSTVQHWFDRSCSLAISERERAHRAMQFSPSPLTRSTFISARNHAKSVLRRAKRSFIRRKCNGLVNSTSTKSFWSLAKSISTNFCKSSFPPLFRTDNSIANSPSDKANLFGSLFSSNSTLDDSDTIPPPLLPLSNTMPLPIVSSRRVYRQLSKLNVGKVYGPDGIPPCV